MSMLAGPRRKQKWTLNPRGKQWSEDSSKFGQKMLEKMGWSSGKGLGAKEQGMVEHVRVKVKNDQVGIGFAKDKDDQWTGHQENFDSFLQNLQKEQFAPTSEENKDKILSGTSLEEKSKNSLKRVHYKKFTRGKDVNKYSSKDLANIFGKKDLDDKPQGAEEEDGTIAYDAVGAEDTTAGVLTIKGGNMNEYFSKKLGTSELQKSKECKDNSESEAEGRAGFGFSHKSKSKFHLDEDANSNIKNSCSESGKYKGFGFIKSSETKSKNKKLNNLDYVFDNPCLDLNILDSPVVKSDKIDNENSESVKKPKKRKTDDMCEDALESEKTEVDRNIETPKKMKKNKKEVVSNGIENLALDSSCSDKSASKKKKKSKDLEDLSGGIENTGLDLEFPDNPTPKNSKKIKESKITFNGIENPALDLDLPDSSTPKRPKKKRDIEVLSGGIENPGLDLEFPDKPTPKKTKRKKNKTEISSNGLENPALDLSYAENEICTTNNFEVPRTSGVENNALNLSDEDSRKKRVTFNDEIEYSTDSVNKKKKKLDKYEVVSEKSKKRKRSKEPVTFDNEALDIEVINVEETDNEVNEKKSKKCKRKRERRVSLLETIEEFPEEENCDDVLIVSEQDSGDVNIVAEFSRDDVQKIKNVDSVKKSKKKKSKKHKEQIEEPKIAEEKMEEIDLTVNETKKKKKKEEPKVIADVEKNQNNEGFKENICNPHVEKNTCFRKINTSDEEVISLEEFFNKTNSKKMSEKTTDTLQAEPNNYYENSCFQRPQSFRTPKQIMKSLFLRTPIAVFKGSNINEIKGYGVDFLNNLTEKY
ncbi:uncharacterized protein LOC106638582 [Copidosoma floridanum]|uniref:uncharacterized protein LOC106638582 n=1 Tax=Copidosoma floridanum TaxID=29053 RepID=UPI0006C9AA8B|nr:uncharacterized protein LOC106638582 [Copidosoma floridanum]